MINNSFDNLQKNNTSTFSLALKMFADLLITFFPSIGYILQVNKFKRTKSSKGFSKIIFLLLIISNILRIYFWIAKQFSIVLLYQSFVIIICQIFLIHYYIKYREEPENIIYPKKSVIKHLSDWKDILNINYIWNWYYEIEYYKFIFFLFLTLTILCGFIRSNQSTFFDWIGSLGVFIETFIEIPQIRENYITKNTKNISFGMVFMWLIRGLFKTVYNVIYKSPMKTIYRGIFQNLEDIILCIQVYKYDDSLKEFFTNKNKYLDLNDDKIINSMNNRIDFEIENNTNGKYS